MSLKRKRTQLTINNKLDIIQYYEENMRLKNIKNILCINNKKQTTLSFVNNSKYFILFSIRFIPT